MKLVNLKQDWKSMCKTKRSSLSAGWQALNFMSSTTSQEKKKSISYLAIWLVYSLAYVASLVSYEF